MPTGTAKSTTAQNESSLTDDGEITYDVAEAIATVTLNRPSAHNALTVPMLRQLAEAIDDARTDSQVRAIVLTGAGRRAFSAGGDLGQLIPPRLTAGELEILVPDPAKRFFSDVFTPIIAAVNGLCLAGGGLEMLLGTDIRIASDRAIFGLPEVRWGLVPGGGTHVRLPQQVPWAIAMQLLLTGDHIDAAQAVRAGLVNEVVPAGTELERSVEVAGGIARNAPPVAVRTAKEIAVRALGNESRFALEASLNERVLRSADAVEGPRAFIENAPPVSQDNKRRSADVRRYRPHSEPGQPGARRLDLRSSRRYSSRLPPGRFFSAARSRRRTRPRTLGRVGRRGPAGHRHPGRARWSRRRSHRHHCGHGSSGTSGGFRPCSTASRRSPVRRFCATVPNNRSEIMSSRRSPVNARSASG